LIRTVQRSTRRPPREHSLAATTLESSSTAARASNESRASGDPILPSAHAACSRTEVSSSDRASESAGTADGSATLPRTIAALRLNPRSLARFIGEPLNAAENSDWDVANSSRASEDAPLPEMTARGANSGTFSSCANLMLNGHTSWEMCRYTHFEIRLSTGGLTLRKSPSAHRARAAKAEGSQ